MAYNALFKRYKFTQIWSWEFLQYNYFRAEKQ